MDLASSFGAIAASLTDGFVTIDEQGIIAAINPAVEEIFGYSDQELLGKNISVLMSARHAVKHQAHLDASTVGKRGRPLTPDRTLPGKKKDGTIIPVSIKVFSLPGDKDTKFFLGLITDQSADEALKEERHKTELLYRNIDLLEGVGLWRFNIASDLLEWTDQVYKIHGLHRESFTPTIQSALEQYHPDDQETVSASILEAINKGESFEFRARLVRPDLSICHVRSSGQSELDSDGNPISIFGTYVDITKEQELAAQFERQAYSLQKLSDELETAKEKAEAASETKSAFLANMSHEVRTPLNGVLGMISLLELSTLDDQQTECIDMAKQAAYAALELINDLLDFSQMEAARLSIYPEDFLLSDLLARLRVMLTPKAEKKSLDLSIESDLTECTVTGDALRIQQILINLGDNAIKFTEAGHIHVHLSQCKETKGLQITVEDTGEGMTRDQLDRIFDRFEQLDPSSTRRHDGVGLGLSICKNLIDLMDGDIRVESTLGNGTCFSVTLPVPLSHTQAPTRPQADNQVPDVHAGLRILAAEDNAMNQEILKRLSKALDFELAIADNGAEAVAMFCPDRFDIILMDIHMPIMDGLEASKTIRATGAEIPILALTADVTNDMAERFARAGINGFVTKPYELGTLVSEIERVIEATDKDMIREAELTQLPHEQFDQAASAR
ncbi:autoinducer 2 sensor kinase/phosphatase LuxQ [Rhodobiaceae bacterium]|nr:autoinducer 2 sensor kinase/phosphatase LuxQ [Rhodobiaceae bacterium]